MQQFDFLDKIHQPAFKQISYIQLTSSSKDFQFRQPLTHLLCDCCYFFARVGVIPQRGQISHFGHCGQSSSNNAAGKLSEIAIIQNNINRMMQKYQAKKSLLITLITVLFVFLLTSIAVLIVECVNLDNSTTYLNQIKNYTPEYLPCNQYCAPQIYEASGQCCVPQSNVCESKQVCYDTAIKQFESQIQNDLYGVTYSAGPALLFFLFLVLIAAYFYRLRKAAQQEFLFQEREALLAQEDVMQEIQYEFDDQSFQNYEEFIQFLIDSGYILPGMMVAPKKRGDPKITDSFGTVDNESCPICMMELNQEKVLKLRCDHKFHSSCIRDWNLANPSCPVCRADIYSD